MIIRPATQEDAAALADLMTQLGYPTTAIEMTSRLKIILCDSHFRTLVAVGEERVCGMIGFSWSASYEQNDETGRIIALVVTEEARRRGIGRELLRAAEEHFASQGVRRVALNTRLEREGAHRFYEAEGYLRTGWRFAKTLR